MKHPDLTIGHRLGIAFGLTTLVLAFVAIAAFVWHSRSVEAQRELVERILPLGARASALERSILYTSVAVRSALIAGDSARRNAARQAIERARADARALLHSRDLPEPDAKRGTAVVNRFLDESETLAGGTAEAYESAQSRLAVHREAAFAEVHAISASHEREHTAAIGRMASARDAVTMTLLASFGLVFLMVALLFVLIVESIRSPARRLVQVAQSLEAGQWKPALEFSEAKRLARGEPAHPRGELARIAAAFGAAAAALEQRDAQLRASRDELKARNALVQSQNERIQAQSEELQSQSEELQAQNEELQAQGAEIHEQNDRLRAQAAELSRADARKNEFLALLAHELRNPLAAISNSIYVMNRMHASPVQLEKSRAVIDRQMRQLTRMVDDLLDVTRIAQGKLRIEMETLDLSELVRDCVEDFRAAIESAGIVLEEALGDTPVMVRADRARLSQVIGNLLSNAIKFTDRGRRIRVSQEASRDDGGAVIRVSDTGLGIDPALMERLFVPFSQGEQGLARGNGGLGLGLALSRALVELHGGRIAVRSDGAGKGAEFSLWLPAAPLASISPAKEAKAEVSGARPRRVLIIEDNVDAADSLRSALAISDHSVEVAYTAADGLRKAREFRPEFVLCDLGLPDMDGFAVARELRSEPPLAKAVLVALSGYAAAEDRERAARSGFDHHFAKPADLGKLNALLAEDA